MTEANYENFSLVARQPRLPAQPSQTATVPLILTLIAIATFLPEESSFYIGPIRMTIVRILLLLIAPATVFRFAQLFSNPSYRFVWERGQALKIVKGKTKEKTRSYTGFWMLLELLGY